MAQYILFTKDNVSLKNLNNNDLVELCSTQGAFGLLKPMPGTQATLAQDLKVNQTKYLERLKTFRPKGLASLFISLNLVNNTLVIKMLSKAETTTLSVLLNQPVTPQSDIRGLCATTIENAVKPYVDKYTYVEVFLDNPSGFGNAFVNNLGNRKDQPQNVIWYVVSEPSLALFVIKNPELVKDYTYLLTPDALDMQPALNGSSKYAKFLKDVNRDIRKAVFEEQPASVAEATRLIQIALDKDNPEQSKQPEQQEQVSIQEDKQEPTPISQAQEVGKTPEVTSEQVTDTQFVTELNETVESNKSVESVTSEAVQTYQQQISQLENTITDLKLENANLHDVNSKLVAENDKLSEECISNNEKVLRYNKLELELDEAKAKLTSNLKTIEELEKSNSDLSNRIIDLESNNRKLEADYFALKQDIEVGASAKECFEFIKQLLARIDNKLDSYNGVQINPTEYATIAKDTSDVLNTTLETSRQVYEQIQAIQADVFKKTLSSVTPGDNSEVAQLEQEEVITLTSPLPDQRFVESPDSIKSSSTETPIENPDGFELTPIQLEPLKIAEEDSNADSSDMEMPELPPLGISQNYVPSIFNDKEAPDIFHMEENKNFDKFFNSEDGTDSLVEYAKSQI